MRLQDLLLCRAQAPGFSIREADFTDVWERRLVELLERRQSYLNQMSDVWGKLTASMSVVAGVLSAELQEQDHLMDLFDKKMKPTPSPSRQPAGSAALDDSLRAAQEQRSVALRARKATLQVTFDGKAMKIRFHPFGLVVCNNERDSCRPSLRSTTACCRS